MDDEDAVQNELLALQQDIVSFYILHLRGKCVLIRFQETEAAALILPSVPEEQPLREGIATAINYCLMFDISILISFTESATVTETWPTVAEGRQKVAVPG